MDHETWTERQRTVGVTVDGHDLEVALYEDGRGNDGPPVVFLHGIPTWSFLWRDVATDLADECHVVAPDLLGYGNSSNHDGFDRSIRAQERMLAELLDELGADAVSLVAHDIGGGVAVRFASHRPDRVDRLVLSNAVCYDSWPVEFVGDLGLPGAVTERSDEEFEGLLDRAFAEGAYADDPETEFVAGMKYPWQREGGRVALERAAVATNTNHTTELDYGAITAETLLLWAEDDVMQPIEYAERLREDVAGDAEIEPLSRAYHWVVQDRADAYAEHLREFLT